MTSFPKIEIPTKYKMKSKKEIAEKRIKSFKMKICFGIYLQPPCQTMQLISL